MPVKGKRKERATNNIQTSWKFPIINNFVYLFINNWLSNVRNFNTLLLKLNIIRKKFLETFGTEAFLTKKSQFKLFNTNSKLSFGRDYDAWQMLLQLT